MHHRQYPPHSQYNSQYSLPYSLQYGAQNSPQYHLQYNPQYSPRYHSHYEPQCSTQNIPQYSPQSSSLSRPLNSREIEQLDRMERELEQMEERNRKRKREIENSPLYISQHKSQYSPPSPITELSPICSTTLALDELENEQLENESHRKNEEKRVLQNSFQKNHIVIRPVSTVSVQKVVSLQAAPVHKTVEVQIHSPPIQQIVLLKAPTPYKMKEMRIPSPPIQNVVPLKAQTPYKIREMRIVSPPVQNVVLLKPFSAHGIVTTTVPSKETPVQQVVTLQVAPVHRVDEIPIPTAPVQQVVSLQITPSMKLVESPVSLCTNSVSELSFFWDPDMNENVLLSNENAVEIENESQSEVSFFWVSEEVTKDVVECVAGITEFTSLKPKPIVPCKVPTVPIQNVSTILVPTNQPSPICDAFLMILTVLIYVAPILISQTKNTTSPPHLKEPCQLSVQKTEILQTKQQFSGTCVTKSRQFCSKKLRSLSHLKTNRRFSTHKAKVTLFSMKPQFSGSCVIKSHQLHVKNRFLGTGWKKKRGKRISCRSVPKGLPHKSHCTVKGSPQKFFLKVLFKT